VGTVSLTRRELVPANARLSNPEILKNQGFRCVNLARLPGDSARLTNLSPFQNRKFTENQSIVNAQPQAQIMLDCFRLVLSPH
jgi:hypothetical protein